LLGALYAWTAAVYFGAVLLDVVYSSLLGSVDERLARPVYGEVSDFLLILAGLSLLAGLAAIAVSWDFTPARVLFAASLLVVAASEFLTPIALRPLLGTSPNPPVLAITPLVRLVPLALASLLALGAFRAVPREQSFPSS
jgi:hypothetical protein